MQNCKNCEYGEEMDVVEQDLNRVIHIFACVKDPIRPQRLVRPLQNCTQFVQKEEKNE